MKVCFMTSTIFNLGGVQRVVSVIASKLSEFYEVDVLCTDNSFEINRSLYNLDPKVNIKTNPKLFNKKISSKVIGKIFRRVNYSTGIFNNKQMKNILSLIYYPKEVVNNFIDYFNSSDYDIVIGVEGYYSILLGIMADKIRAKTIGWQHNSYDAYLNNKGRYYWHQNELFNIYIPKLDKYLVLTKYDKDMYLKENNIKCTVMHNPKSFSSIEKCDVTKKQFLAAGRFTHQKGFDLLIKAFLKYSQIEKEWVLTIVGEGEDKEKIQQLIDEYKLNNRVMIKPFTDNIKDYFLNSSILALSSRWEGMPMIVLEALEMGVPIVSFNITAVHELVDNEREGLIVEKFDTDKFSKAMHKLSSNYEVRYKFSKNAIKKSEKFDIDEIIKKWIDICEEITFNIK